MESTSASRFTSVERSEVKVSVTVDSTDSTPQTSPNKSYDGCSSSRSDPDDEHLSPTRLSRRKRIWNSFKKTTRKFRKSRSKDRESVRKPKFTPFSASQPDISNYALNTLCTENAGRLSQGPRGHPQGNHVAVHGGKGMANGMGGDHKNYSESNLPSLTVDIEEQDSGITLVDSQDSQEAETRIRALREHPFHQLDITLFEGRDLVVRDAGGSSDPYVKFKVGGKQLYKSKTIFKNLNPRWDEKFSLPIDDVFKPIQVRVFDYDRGPVTDDHMGSAEIDLTTLDLNSPTELSLKLSESGNDEYMGYIRLQATLVPKTQEEKEHLTGINKKKYIHKGGHGSTSESKKLKMQIWTSVVNIVLVEGQNLMAMDDNGLSDPYVKFKLGNEKYKSKCKSKTLNPKWPEEFSLHMFDGHSKQMDVSVWDRDVTGRDDFMGRATIDLGSLQAERTHVINCALEDGAGTIKLLLTISGTSGTETVSDLSNYTPLPYERDDILHKYGIFKSFKNIRDIGWLQVKVIKAENLPSADVNGKSDPYCVLQLCNDRLQTQTEYKTLNPDWNKVFTFNVRDIHDVLEITVYDEDRDKRKEFLGRVDIPLLSINRGERKWYALKNKKLCQRAKGAIQLELDLIYNHIKAAVRTVNPREERVIQVEPKFKISEMKQNINRVHKIITAIYDTGQFVQSCFTWESKPRTLIAFLSFQIIVWNFELYMLPLTFLLIFLWNYMMKQMADSMNKDTVETSHVQNTSSDESDEDEDSASGKEKEEKRGFRERYQAIQNVCLKIQTILDYIACIGERIKNTFNWSVPWLSTLAVVALTVATILLYLVPLRLIVFVWGIHKFTKKLRKPNAISNNEILDFLSRVPSDKQLLWYKELSVVQGMSRVTSRGKMKTS